LFVIHVWTRILSQRLNATKPLRWGTSVIETHRLSSDSHYYLAKLPVLFQITVNFPHLVELEYAVDDRF
jgi:hypothetical protein